MTELLPGVLAEGTEAPPRPYRIRDSGRRDPAPAEWARPLAPVLWERLPEAVRERHERAVEAYGDANAKAVELAARARQAASDDEQALRAAIASGSKLPKPKAVAAEQAAEAAERAADMAAKLLIESGRSLAEGFSDGEVEAAASEAGERARAIIEVIPELVGRMLEELQEAGRLGSEAAWCATLAERRSAGPWTPATRPLTHRLAAAAEAARLLQTHLHFELDHEAAKSATVEHHIPAGAPPVDTWSGWTAGPIDASR